MPGGGKSGEPLQAISVAASWDCDSGIRKGKSNTNIKQNFENGITGPSTVPTYCTLHLHKTQSSRFCIPTPRERPAFMGCLFSADEPKKKKVEKKEGKKEHRQNISPKGHLRWLGNRQLKRRRLAMFPNATPLAILASYMVTAVALAVCCIRVIRGHPPRASRPSAVSFTVFTTLSILSLATTWSYMFAYFRWSYLDWAASSSPPVDANQLRLGEWLHDTSLFKQAWFSALETPARAWWTLQIFGFCAIWSVMLSVQGKSLVLSAKYPSSLG